MTETTLSTNYGDFLRSSVEKIKDQFSDEEYKTLTADAEKIRAIEEQTCHPCPRGRGRFPALPHRALPSPSLRAAI